MRTSRLCRFGAILVVAVLCALPALAQRQVRVPEPAKPSSPPPGNPDTPSEWTSKSTGMTFVLIKAGTFRMGSPDSDKEARDDEKPAHQVRITQPFFLGIHEVTQQEYEKVIGQNPSALSPRGRYSKDVVGQDTNRSPVESVSWHDAIAYCNKLSELDGLPPYYRLGAGERSGGPGYRLPTEAEWEYACRAGTTTTYHFGDDAGRLGEYDWFRGNSGTSTHPVGQKLPNAFGLFDMNGNVMEWCGDGYDKDYYQQSPAEDPLGPSRAFARVTRGGGWNGNPLGARSARRIWTAPHIRYIALGFRVARTQSSR